MSDEKKDAPEEYDLNTAYGRFMNDKDNPDTPAYFIDGLLSQTDPRLKEQLLEDYQRLFRVADVFGGLMEKIMSTPQGQREFQRELDKFVARRNVNDIKGEGSGQEDT